MAEHKLFTVERTSLVRDDDRQPAWAIFYGAQPRETEDGMIVPMRFPLLVVTEIVDDRENAANEIARILNDHWPQGEPA